MSLKSIYKMKNTLFAGRLPIALLILAVLIAYTPVQAGGNVSEFDVNGLKVILKYSPKEIISASLFVEGGVTNYPQSKQGIESLALGFALEGGTENLDKTAFSAAAEKNGTDFSSTTTYDFGTLNMSCVKMFWDEAWTLFADALMNPAFNEEEFKLYKEQAISNVREGAADPDTHLRNIAMKASFGGTVYSTIPSGTPESLKALTLEEVKNYYRALIGKKRVFLVVVGDVEEQDLRSKLAGSLANLPEGEAASYEDRALIEEAGSFLEDRDIATNYIRGLMSAPTIDTQEGVAMWIAMSILRDRFFLELRTKRGLTYAPAAFYATGILKNPYNVLYVSTTDPKQSIEVMVDELDKIKESGFGEKELRNEKQTFLTGYYMGQQTTATQAAALGSAEITGGWEMADQLTERVNKVTLEELNRVFDEYTNIISWTYLGKADMVNTGDFLQPSRHSEVQKPLD
jgi:predicted Zn-dependent peptidase